MGAMDFLSNNDQEAYVVRNWTAPNVEEVTIHVAASGTESDSEKYLNKGFSGHGYTIVADQDIEITDVSNGGVTVHKGDPIQVSANTRRTRALKHPDFNTMKINVLTANTNIQLEVF